MRNMIICSCQLFTCYSHSARSYKYTGMKTFAKHGFVGGSVTSRSVGSDWKITGLSWMRVDGCFRWSCYYAVNVHVVWNCDWIIVFMFHLEKKRHCLRFLFCFLSALFNCMCHYWALNLAYRLQAPKTWARWRNGLARLQYNPCYLQGPGFESHLWPVEFFICNKISPLNNRTPNANICSMCPN